MNNWILPEIAAEIAEQIVRGLIEHIENAF